MVGLTHARSLFETVVKRAVGASPRRTGRAGRRRVALYISNPRHHVDMIRGVIPLLHRDGLDVVVVSLCELRGFATPREQLRATGARCVTLLPERLRRSPSHMPGPSLGVGPAGQRRQAVTLRAALWHGYLGPRLRWGPDLDADVAVLPNDAAYPFDAIARSFRQRGIPFLLVQEGIRFPFPGVEPDKSYGCGGASAIAAWGASSARYFAGLGVSPDSIVVTGSPRFDDFAARNFDESAREVARELAFERPVLGLLTNPIDDQGFCSEAEKLQLVRRFVQRAAPVLAARGWSLAVKLHGRENEAAYTASLRDVVEPLRWVVTRDAPLGPLLATLDAAVVMASTAGLEALLHGVKLGVLEIPGAGYAHDYVQHGAATALPDTPDVVEGLQALLAQPGLSGDAKSYVDDNLAHRGDAASQVAAAVRQWASSRPA